MSSAICFNLDQSKILLSGNGSMRLQKKDSDPAGCAGRNVPHVTGSFYIMIHHDKVNFMDSIITGR